MSVTLSGIFTWNGAERRSDRYGSFVLDSRNYENTERSFVKFDADEIGALVGRKVEISCKIVRAMKSGHCGDLAHEIFPSTPEVGEVILLGVGMLFMEQISGIKLPCVGLKPDDGRSKWWIDPHLLYRLHDQEMLITITETDKPFSDFAIPDHEWSGMKSTGDSMFQLKNMELKPEDRAIPRVIDLGNGLFEVNMDFKLGDDVEIIKS